MKKNIDMLEVSLVVLLALCIVFTGISAAYNSSVFIAEAVFTAGALVLVLWRIVKARKDSRNFLEYISGRLGAVKEDALKKFPLPVAVMDSNNRILWANGVFCSDIVKNSEFYGQV